MKIFTKILIGVAIVLITALFSLYGSFQYNLFINTKYVFPSEIEKVKQDVLKKDTMDRYQNRVQNKFIYENRAMLKSLIQNDSTKNEILKDILFNQKILLKNNREASIELEKIKSYFPNNRYTETAY